MPGTVMGTVGYMWPEQVRGEPAGTTSDIFSLGCVLYEMVNGRRPFARNSVAETFSAILYDALPALAKAPTAIPSGVEGVIRGCLEKDGADRYSSTQAVASDLCAATSLTPTQQPTEVHPRPRRRWLLWHAVLALIGMAGLGRAQFMRARGPIDSLAVTMP